MARKKPTNLKPGQIDLSEKVVVEKVIEYLTSKKDEKWVLKKFADTDKHEKGPDIEMESGTRRYYIECKGKSYAETADSINKEGWLNALGQLVTRMHSSSTIKSGATIGKPAYHYKYGLGLCKESARIALHRIPQIKAKELNIHIFSVNDYGIVREFDWKDFHKEFHDPKDFD